ncbi:MAG: hypothetical protein AAF108_00850 [Planctomycetota bacterium]
MRHVNICFGLVAAGWGTLGVSGQVLGGPMKHLLISQAGQSLAFSFETPVDGPLELTQAPLNEFTGAASVLNGTGYNAQFGWLASGFFSLPVGSGVFVRTLEQSEGLSAYDAFTFQPILGTDGSDEVWQWSGAMTHNWYTASSPGVYAASYEVFVGDALGQPLDGWDSALVDLSWELSLGWFTQLRSNESVIKYVNVVVGPLGPGIAPAPAAGVVLFAAVGCITRRR